MSSRLERDGCVISVVIPSWSGKAATLKASLVRQTWRPDQIEMAIRISPNGRARNVGVSKTTGDIVVFIDDDAVLGNDDAIERMVRPLLSDSTIHITGASKLIPADSSWFQKWIAREVPRIEHNVVTEPLDTTPQSPDYRTEITTTCMAMRRDDFVTSGGFSEQLVRGVDTEYFSRVAKLGYRFVLVPHTWTWHPAPSNVRKLFRKHFLYGMGHAQELEVDPKRAKGLERRPFLYFLFRTAALIPNIFFPYSYNAPSWKPNFKPLKALTSYAGAVGFTWHHLRSKLGYNEAICG